MSFKPSSQVAFCLCFISVVSSVYIEENGYKGITISISDHIKKSEFNFHKLKAILQKSSEYLFKATKNRTYFEEFVILVPSDWLNDPCTNSTYQTPKKVDVYVTDSIDKLKTQHSKGCGLKGDVIYIPVTWLDENTEDIAYQFTRQWAIYRYGVFEENSIEEDACFISKTNKWYPVGCYNKEISKNPNYQENGIVKCDQPDITELSDIQSSLMYHSNSSEAFNFCDGSTEFPHNPVMPTMHNILCGGETVWSVIMKSNDFINGKNRPVKSIPRNIPSFMCYKEPEHQFTFVIQSSYEKSSTEFIDHVFIELQHSLYIFIKYLAPKSFKFNLMTFSSKEDFEQPISLDKVNGTNLIDLLREKIHLTMETSKPCLLCGLQTALKAATESSSHPTIILLAWESALNDQKIIQKISELQKFSNMTVHLILIKDKDSEFVTADLINALRLTGGSFHFLPNHSVPNKSGANVLLSGHLNIILTSIVQRPLQVDNKLKLVHNAIYNQASEIEDTFTVPTVSKGKLVYSMLCDKSFQIKKDPNCSEVITELSSFKCVTEIDLAGKTKKTWTYKFGIIPNPRSNPICTSTAFLDTSSSFEKMVSLNGWLSEYIITPGENAVIIYAEVMNMPKDVIAYVNASIRGPNEEVDEIELKDNGNGDPDVRSGDDIYSRYFTSFTEKGIYVVTISMKISAVSHSILSENGATETTSELTQSKIVGSFIVTEKPPEIDIIPPNRVADLRVIFIDHENSSVTLQWTAPGNNSDFGKAAKYEIKSAMSPANLMDLYFKGEDTNTLGIIEEPQNSGTKEIHTFHFKNNAKNTIYYIALQAEDASKNRGNISNIVQVYIKKSNTITPEIYESTVEPSTDSDETSTIHENKTEDSNFTNSDNTADILIDISSTTNIVVTTPETSWQDALSDTKMIIVLSSAGTILLILIIINIIIWFCYVRRRSKSKNIPRKSTLRPPYNLNIAYQHDSQSINQSESDADVSIKSFVNQNMYSSSPKGEERSNRRYSYHTSKSISNKSKSQTDSELGFKLVDTVPVYASRSLSRFARRLGENDEEDGSKSSVVQPQQPSSNNNEPMVYTLGEV